MKDRIQFTNINLNLNLLKRVIYKIVMFTIILLEPFTLLMELQILGTMALNKMRIKIVFFSFLNLLYLFFFKKKKKTQKVIIRQVLLVKKDIVLSV